MYDNLDLSNTIDNIPLLETDRIVVDFSPVYLDLWTEYTLFPEKQKKFIYIYTHINNSIN